MKKYSIPCTPEQTKKAFELGAPIEFEMECPVNLETLERSPYPDIKMGKDGEPILIIPTAEEMVGWLEEQGLLISITARNTPDNPIYNYSINRCEESWTTFSTRKEATLASIDAALDYLTNNK